MTDRRVDLDRFYSLIDDLRVRIGGARLLRDCSKSTGWPSHGVYFFLEDGEIRENGQPRIVRVGTHAVSTGSKTTLWNRLSNHRGFVAGANAGGGNHRGSIFRLHVGRALIARDCLETEGAKTWGVGGSAPKAICVNETEIEKAVTRYIGAMPFLWVDVPGGAGATSDRKVIETGAIALLSNRKREPIDPPSPIWLGRYSPQTAINESGLWNVRHVDEQHVSSFLEVLERHVARTS